MTVRASNMGGNNIPSLNYIAKAAKPAALLPKASLREKESFGQADAMMPAKERGAGCWYIKHCEYRYGTGLKVK